jgi:hypothetical protein
MTISAMYVYLAVCQSQTPCTLSLSAFLTSAILFVCLPISLLGRLPP